MSIEKNEFGLYATEIDGIEYTFTKWGAEESFSTLLKISKLIGKPLSLLVSTVLGEGGLDSELKTDAMALAIEGLTTNLDEAMAMSLVKKLATDKCFADGAKITFNTHYEDRLDHMLKVVKAGLEVQYGNFFGALLGLAKGMAPKAKQGLKNMAI
jgi:hypothetical protein